MRVLLSISKGVKFINPEGDKTELLADEKDPLGEQSHPGGELKYPGGEDEDPDDPLPPRDEDEEAVMSKCEW